MEVSERYGRPENLGVRIFPFRELTPSSTDDDFKII
jgi:hypothetical protein